MGSIGSGFKNAKFSFIFLLFSLYFPCYSLCSYLVLLFFTYYLFSLQLFLLFLLFCVFFPYYYNILFSLFFYYLHYLNCTAPIRKEFAIANPWLSHGDLTDKHPAGQGALRNEKEGNYYPQNSLSTRGHRPGPQGWSRDM